MSREKWMHRINELGKKINRRMVMTRANDPNLPSLGDYYIVDTRTNAIVLRHHNFASFAKQVAASRRRLGRCS
jgi:hypothetical protein